MVSMPLFFMMSKHSYLGFREEISIQSSQNRRNLGKDVLIQTVERGHMADMACLHENYEVMPLLCCGGPHDINVTKHASDLFQLTRMLKDQLDDILSKVQQARMDNKGIYTLGVQVCLVVCLIDKNTSV